MHTLYINARNKETQIKPSVAFLTGGRAMWDQHSKKEPEKKWTKWTRARYEKKCPEPPLCAVATSRVSCRQLRRKGLRETPLVLRLARRAVDEPSTWWKANHGGDRNHSLSCLNGDSSTLLITLLSSAFAGNAMVLLSQLLSRRCDLSRFVTLMRHSCARDHRDEAVVGMRQTTRTQRDEDFICLFFTAIDDCSAWRRLFVLVTSSRVRRHVMVTLSFVRCCVGAYRQTPVR